MINPPELIIKASIENIYFTNLCFAPFVLLICYKYKFFAINDCFFTVYLTGFFLIAIFVLWGSDYLPYFLLCMYRVSPLTCNNDISSSVTGASSGDGDWSSDFVSFFFLLRSFLTAASIQTPGQFTGILCPTMFYLLHWLIMSYEAILTIPSNGING